MLHRHHTSTLFPYTTLFRSPLTSAEDHMEQTEDLRPAPQLGHCNLACFRFHQHPDYLPRNKEMSIVLLEMKTKKYLLDRKSTRLNSSHVRISYAVFCLKKKN